MSIVTPGFRGRGRSAPELPPGQYLVHDFPVLTAGPTPVIDPEDWTLTVRTESGEQRQWTWTQLMALPQESPTVDIHCVTKWSKLDTTWKGVSLDVLLGEVGTAADFALARAQGGYTTNMPLEDLLHGRAWLVHTYEEEPLRAEHGGPVRLLVPHLYLWKSAKWITGLDLVAHDEPGFWESLGYHDYGDPWREQRYQGD